MLNDAIDFVYFVCSNDTKNVSCLRSIAIYRLLSTAAA